MQNSSFDKKMSKSRGNDRRFSKQTTFIVIGVFLAALIGMGALFFSDSSGNVVTSAQAGPTPPQGKKFKATKNIVTDRETGQTRKPNAAELEELVKTLETLTKRPEENLESVQLPSGGVALDVEEGFGGTMLARPNADGTFETKCVFTFEEAIEFLGLVEDNS